MQGRRWVSSHCEASPILQALTVHCKLASVCLALDLALAMLILVLALKRSSPHEWETRSSSREEDAWASLQAGTRRSFMIWHHNARNMQLPERGLPQKWRRSRSWHRSRPRQSHR